MPAVGLQYTKISRPKTVFEKTSKLSCKASENMLLPRKKKCFAKKKLTES